MLINQCDLVSFVPFLFQWPALKHWDRARESSWSDWWSPRQRELARDHRPPSPGRPPSSPWTLLWGRGRPCPGDKAAPSWSRRKSRSCSGGCWHPKAGIGGTFGGNFFWNLIYDQCSNWVILVGIMKHVWLQNEYKIKAEVANLHIIWRNYNDFVKKNLWNGWA